MTTIATQTKSDRSEKEETEEICVSSVDPNICMQEEKTHNVEPPTMTTTSQLEASRCMITEALVGTIEKSTSTAEAEEDTPLFWQKLLRLLAAATKKDRNLRPLKNFEKKKKDWDCLLIDERIVIPTQLRQIVLNSLHLTHPGSAAKLDISVNMSGFRISTDPLCKWHKTAHTALNKVKI